MPGYEQSDAIQEARNTHMQAIMRHQEWLSQLERQEAENAQQAYVDGLERDRMLHESTRETWSLVENVLADEQQLIETNRQTIEQAERVSAESNPFTENISSSPPEFPSPLI